MSEANDYMRWRDAEKEPPPKDVGPILALCDDVWEVERMTPEQRKSLAPYLAAAEFSTVGDGPHVIEWGSDGDGNECWFQYGSDFIRAANPVFWTLIPSQAEYWSAGEE